MKIIDQFGIERIADTVYLGPSTCGSGGTIAIVKKNVFHGYYPAQPFYLVSSMWKPSEVERLTKGWDKMFDVKASRVYSIKEETK